MRPTPLVEVHVRSRRVRGSYAQQALKACREKLAHDCGPENRLTLILEILIQDGDVGFFQSRLPESRHVSAGFPEHVAGAVRQPREELRGHEATGHRVVIDAADVEPHRDAHVARVGRASPCDLRVYDPCERNGLTFLGQGCGHPEGVCCREHALEARHVGAPGFQGFRHQPLRNPRLRGIRTVGHVDDKALAGAVRMGTLQVNLHGDVGGTGAPMLGGVGHYAVQQELEQRPVQHEPRVVDRRADHRPAAQDGRGGSGQACSLDLRAILGPPEFQDHLPLPEPPHRTLQPALRLG